MGMSNVIAAAGLMVASLGAATLAQAQDHSARPGAKAPELRKSVATRQYRGAPKAIQASQGTRCRIVRQRGQDRRVCDKAVSRSAPK